MRKWIPSFIVFSFLISFSLRLGMLSYDYWDQWLHVKAETVKQNKDNLTNYNSAENTLSNEEQQDILPSKKSSAKNIQNTKDKLHQVSDYKIKKTHFSSKVSGRINDKDPKKMCITSPMLKDASRQLEYLDKRHKEIKVQLKLLETSDRRVREQIAKLKLIKDNVVEAAKLADSKIQKESQHLISIYEKMKPKEAAKIFNEMAPNIAAELLRTMKENNSSQILSKMDPKMAYDVTLALAGGIKKTKDHYNTIK